nr:hypothetical protein [Mycobacterium leprae]
MLSFTLSYNYYEIVAANLIDDDPLGVNELITTYALYIDSLLGSGGMTADQAHVSGSKALVG